MTWVERLVWRGIAVVMPVSILLAILSVGGMRWAGPAIALIILAWPPVLLLTVGASRVVEWVRRGPGAALGAKGRGMISARIMVFLALYGILGWVVLGIFADLNAADETDKVAAGWVVMGLYVGPPAICFLVLMRSFFLAVLQMFTAPDYHRCLVQVMGGRQAEAVTAFARYQQKYPADPRSHDGLALALFMNHRFEEALGEADRALEAAPTAERLHLRGAILSHLGDDEGALQDFEASLRLKPGFQESEFGLTAVLLNLRRLDSAIGFLERSRRWWRPPHYFLYLGEAYRLRGMLDAATDAYQMAVRTPLAIGLGLSSGAAQQGFFAYLLVNAGKLKEAEKAAQRSLAKDPRQPLALLAQAAVQKEKSDPALENTLERLLEVNPNYVVAELTDPEFTPLLADERFRALLARAWQERDRILGRVRQRPGITQSGAAN